MIQFPKLCELCVSVVISFPSVFSPPPSAPCKPGRLAYVGKASRLTAWSEIFLSAVDFRA